jgi:hypothetical protein
MGLSLPSLPILFPVFMKRSLRAFDAHTAGHIYVHISFNAAAQKF